LSVDEAFNIELLLAFLTGMASWSSPTPGKSGTDDVVWTEHFFLDFVIGRFSFSVAGDLKLYLNIILFFFFFLFVKHATNSDAMV